MLGLMSKDEALKLAKDQAMDLIEIAPNAKPPVAKILDFQKFRYEENKKEQAARKGSNEGGLKELWLSPRIADHDLHVRLRRAEDFLKDGFKVKLTVKFKGREMAHPEVGRDVLNQTLAYFADKVKVEREAKFEGRKLSMILAKGSANKNNESQVNKGDINVQNEN